VPVQPFKDTDEIFKSTRLCALEHNMEQKDDKLIVTVGVNGGEPGATNLLKVLNFIEMLSFLSV